MSGPSAVPLRMVRLLLDRTRLPYRGPIVDLGDVVHGVLAGLFGPGRLQPFHVGDSRTRWLPILAYARADEVELRDHAATFAEPQFTAAWDSSSLAMKDMPAIPAGRRLGFEVVVCPVVRLASAVEAAYPDGTKESFAAKSEVDVWLRDAFMRRVEGQRPDREAVYRSWLAERLSGAAELESAALRSFRRERLMRRRQGAERKSEQVERPVTRFEGVLRVADESAFLTLLARGVGRHRAFGFGMLLLRPPS